MESNCTVCLDRLKYPIGRPENCEHKFCFQCISDWFKNRSQCPLCFGTAPKHLIKIDENMNETKVAVKKRTAKQFENELIIREQLEEGHTGSLDEDITIAYATCRSCQRSDNEHLLLLCDGNVGQNADGSMIHCNVAYHSYCLPEKLEKVPKDDWFCPFCANKPENAKLLAKQTNLNVSPSEVVGTSDSTFFKNEPHFPPNRSPKEDEVKTETIECSSNANSASTTAHGAFGDSDTESESIGTNCSDENNKLCSETDATADNYDDEDVYEDTDSEKTIESSNEITIDDSEEVESSTDFFDDDDELDDEESNETDSEEKSNRSMFSDDPKRGRTNRNRGKAVNIANKVAGFMKKTKSKSGKTVTKYQEFIMTHRHLT